MQIRRRLTKEEMDYRLSRLVITGPYRGQALATLAWVPVAFVVLWRLEPFAGARTELTVSVGFTFSLTANLAMGIAVRRKSKAMNEQSDELNRLRGRVDALEEATGTLGKPPKGGPK